MKARIFSLLLKGEVKFWYQGLKPTHKGTCEASRTEFLRNYGGGDNPQELWQKISLLQLTSLVTDHEYVSNFLKLWTQWVTSLPKGEQAPKSL